MSDERGKHGLAFWMTMFVALVLVIYPLAIGPLVWVERHGLLVEPLKSVVGIAYFPVRKLAEKSPVIDNWLNWYADLWANPTTVP